VTSGGLSFCMHGVYVGAGVRNVSVSDLDISDFGTAGIVVEAGENVHISSCRVGPALNRDVLKSFEKYGLSVMTGRGTVVGIAATPAGGLKMVARHLSTRRPATGSGLRLRRLQVTGVHTEVQECVFAAQLQNGALLPSHSHLGDPIHEEDTRRLRECAAQQRGWRPAVTLGVATITYTGFLQNACSNPPDSEVVWTRGVDSFCAPLRGAYGVFVCGWHDVDLGASSDLLIEEPSFTVLKSKWTKPLGANAALINSDERHWWGSGASQKIHAPLHEVLRTQSVASYAIPWQVLGGTSTQSLLQSKGSFTVC
jgi:hypothetical protein